MACVRGKHVLGEGCDDTPRVRGEQLLGGYDKHCAKGKQQLGGRSR